MRGTLFLRPLKKTHPTIVLVIVEQEDDERMRRAAGGDTDAFGQIVRAHQKRLLGFAARMLNGDADAAQDIVQEAFVRLWHARDRYEPRNRLDTFLLRIVHNLCRDEARREARGGGAAQPLDECADLVSSAAPLADALRASAVREAVADLPPEQRAVFVLSQYEGLRYHEIADLLQCPVGTVASRKHAAVAALRSKLRPWFDEET